MAASTSIPLSDTSQKAFIAYYNSMQDSNNAVRSNQRSRMESIDRAYQRENDKTQEQLRAKAANDAGDPTRLQNTTVPVVMPQVETAVTYQSGVFLTGSPLFGVVASPEFENEALQMESVIEDESIRGGWARELMMFFRDGEKYNLAPIEVSWEQEVTFAVETDLTKSKDQGIAKQVIWSGNKIKRLDPYNTFFDQRVAPTEVYKKGEFAGYTEYMPRMELKTYIETLPDKIIGNIAPAFESGGGDAPSTGADSRSFYIPDINPAVTDDDYKGTGTNWMSWAGLSSIRKSIDYKDTYEVTTLYCRVLPSEFELRVPNRNIPQIYKLIIVNHEHIIYCERQTNAHNYLPILIGQPNEDGLRMQTKSLATNVQPFQEVASTLMNSITASRRRAISDRVLYDPSRISKAHINSANPSAKIPIRPSAYGKNVADAVYQFPYREDQAGVSMQQVAGLMDFADQTSGHNQASRGQFVKGNRTLEEFDQTMQNANGREQTSSILTEFQVFVPLKLVLKLNILQYQGGTTIYNRDKKQSVEIDPVALRKAVLHFKISDGLIPASKLISSENFGVALQVLGSSPEMAAGYNMAPMFSYLMKTKGADLSPFEKSPEQQAYEQALGSWQQLAMLAVEKGIEPEKLPPQPLPEQYGYQPSSQTPTPKSEQEENPNNAPTPGNQ